MPLVDLDPHYEAFGVSMSITGRDAIVVIPSQGMDITDSKMQTFRTQVASVIERGDVVQVSGSEYRVTRVTPHGGYHTEKLLTLRPGGE